MSSSLPLFKLIKHSSSYL